MTDVAIPKKLQSKSPQPTEDSDEEYTAIPKDLLKKENERKLEEKQSPAAPLQDADDEECECGVWRCVKSLLTLRMTMHRWTIATFIGNE